MSARISPCQAPPPHGIPDFAIDALLGRGLAHDGWKSELVDAGHHWVPGLRNRIIKRELWYFKDEIGRLLSTKDTNQGHKPRRRSRYNSAGSVLRQLKGKTGERETRLSNRTLIGPDTSKRTLQDYIKQWREEDSSYGNPDLASRSIGDTDTGSAAAPMSDYQAEFSDRLMVDETANFDRATRGDVSAWLQPEPEGYDAAGSSVDHNHVSHFYQRNDNSVTGRLSPTIFDDANTGDGHFSNFEREAFNNLPESPFNTVHHESGLPVHAVSDWSSLNTLAASDSMSGYALDQSDLDGVDGPQTSVPFDQSHLNQISSGEVFVPSGPSMDPFVLQDPSQDGPCEDRLFAALNQALLPENSHADLSGDTQMADVSFSPHGNQTDDDLNGPPAERRHLASRPSRLAQSNVALTLPQRSLKHSIPARQNAHLRQKVVFYKSQSRATIRELEEARAENSRKDAEILELKKRLTLSEILGKQASQHSNDFAMLPSSEASHMDDANYQEILHNKIFQEARAKKQSEVASKEASEISINGTATDEGKEDALQRGITSPERRTPKIIHSKRAIDLRLRVASNSTENSIQQPKSAHNSENDKVPESPTTAENPGQGSRSRSRSRSRAGRLVRQISDTLLGRPRENPPSVPMLRPWKDVHDDIGKRHTDDSGYASFDFTLPADITLPDGQQH